MSNKINNDFPLCCDLDGTLIKSDMLYESVLLLLKQNLFFIFIIPFWLIKGRIYLKNHLYKRVCPNAELLPYNEKVIEYLKIEKNNGRKLILVTASMHGIAVKINEYLNLFDEVFGSYEKTNLIGRSKKQFLVEKYGEKNFDYIGDSEHDVEIFNSSRHAILVNPSKKTIKLTSNSIKIISDKVNFLSLIIKEIRVYQWVKNVLIFLPLLLAHKLDIILFKDAILGFLSFSFAASSIYVINDLLDLESDRNHHRKRNRPIASGKLSIKSAIIAPVLLFILSISIAFSFLNLKFIIILFIYLVLTNLYTFIFKKLYLTDIITLSVLYTIRLIAGGFATDVVISPWLLIFSMFIFTSLACVKRFTELNTLKEKNQSQIKGRGYNVDDISLVSSIGTGAGLISVMVFALYVSSPEVIKLYKNPVILYSACPILLYWILRAWFKANRQEMHDDPIVFMAKDPISYLLGLAITIIVFGAML